MINNPHYSPTASFAFEFFHSITVPNPPVPKDLSLIQSPMYGSSSIMMILDYRSTHKRSKSGPASN